MCKFWLSIESDLNLAAKLCKKGKKKKKKNSECFDSLLAIYFPCKAKYFKARYSSIKSSSSKLFIAASLLMPLLKQ